MARCRLELRVEVEKFDMSNFLLRILAENLLLLSLSLHLPLNGCLLPNDLKLEIRHVEFFSKQRLFELRSNLGG